MERGEVDIEYRAAVSMLRSTTACLNKLVILAGSKPLEEVKSFYHLVLVIHVDYIRNKINRKFGPLAWIKPFLPLSARIFIALFYFFLIIQALSGVARVYLTRLIHYKSCN